VIFDCLLVIPGGQKSDPNSSKILDLKLRLEIQIKIEIEISNGCFTDKNKLLC
jgi:hypothetical protein